MTYRRLLFSSALTAMVAVAACRDDASPSREASAASSTAPLNDAQRAATITNAITASPMRTDSVLAAHGITAEQLQQLMLTVARDSALSTEYGRLTAR